MPIKIQKDLPAKAILESENIFVMDEDRAMSQDIRPLEILILNLMPIKLFHLFATSLPLRECGLKYHAP